MGWSVLVLQNTVMQRHKRLKRDITMGGSYDAGADGDLLRSAVEAGDAEKLKTVLSELQDRVDINRVFWKDGKSALMFIGVKDSTEGGVDCMRALIAAGMDLNMVDKDGMTALMHASVNRLPDQLASRKRGDDFAQVLINAGACLDLVNKDGRSALILAAMTGSYFPCDSLLRAGARTDLVDKMGMSALAYAAQQSDDLTILFLFSNWDGGADVTMGEKGRTALMELVVAPAEMEEGSVMAFFPTWEGGKGGANPDIVDQDGKSALMLAAERGKILYLNDLIKFGRADLNLVDKAGNSASQLAADAGEVECLNALVKAGAEVDEMIKSVLWYGAAREGYVDGVKLLLDQGVTSVDMVNSDGKTALMLSAEEGRVECLKPLIEAGADMEGVVEKRGLSSLLWWAADVGDVEWLQELIKRGADVNAHNSIKSTALMQAVINGHVTCVRCLVQAGAELDRADDKNPRLHQPRKVSRLIMAITPSRILRKTAMMHAARLGRIECLNMLIEGGATVDIPPPNPPGFDAGPTPLWHARGDEQCTKALLKAGADVSWMGNSINTSEVLYFVHDCACVGRMVPYPHGGGQVRAQLLHFSERDTGDAEGGVNMRVILASLRQQLSSI